MHERTELEEIRDILAELRSLMETEKATRHLPGIVQAAICAEQADGDPAMLRSLKSIVRTMAGGSGSFQDLVIWRDDDDERIRINDRLEELRLRLFHLADQMS